MGAARPGYPAGRIEELQRENEDLREQLRRYAAAQSVARGAIEEAAHEKDATARIAHQVAVEERATRTAVEVQGNSIGFGVIMTIVNFFMLLVLAIGLFGWLPREIENRVRPATTVIAPTAGAPVTSVPVR